MRCGDYFGTNVPLTSEWTTYSIDFSETRQRGIGLSVPSGFAKDAAYQLRAQVRGNAESPVSFDLWIDDIYFAP
jgi:hypothetical protein